MDNVITFLAIIGALYLGATACIVGFFVAVKRLNERDEKQNQKHEDQALQLVKEELGGTILHYEN